MSFCGLCWKGQGNIRLHYCDDPLGHQGPHRCHCGAILEKPVRLAPLNSPSAWTAHIKVAKKAKKAVKG